jgi:hypothetical protein
LSIVCNFRDKEEDALLDLASHDMDSISKDYIKETETDSPAKYFYALDMQCVACTILMSVASHSDEYPSSDLELSSDCETGFESRLRAPHLGLEFSHHGFEGDHSDVWLSDTSSDEGYSEDLHSFSRALCPSFLDEEQQQSTSEESNCDYLSFHDTLVPSFQCDWSPDLNTSQEKVIHSSLGMASSPDCPSFPEVEPHKLPDLIY